MTMNTDNKTKEEQKNQEHEDLTNLLSDKPVQFVYNITNQESWSAAFKQFFKGFFALATVTVILGFLTDAAGCVDLVKVIHGP